MADPAEGAIVVDTCQQLLTNALVDAGVVGIDEAVEQPVLNRAFTQANWLLAQWARKRWLCYRLAEYSFVSSGSQTYPVGNIGANTVGININPRPDRLEYAFLRFLNQSPGNLPVDIPIDIIQSRQDYSRIRVKTIGTLPWQIFYDPGWPLGTLYPWPVPQATIYGIFCGFKVVLPRFAALNQKINFPPEYEAAMNWCLAKRFRATYQLPPDASINQLARDGLNVIRLGNQAMSTVRMPRGLPGMRGGGRAYDYRGDSDSM